MNTYTVTSGRINPGIACDEQARVVLGQSCRGSRQICAPLLSGAVIDWTPGVNGRPATGLVRSVPGSPGSIAVVVCDHSGYRGGWHLRAARPEADWDKLVARAAAHCPPSGEGALAGGHTVDGSCPLCDQLVGTVPTTAEAMGVALPCKIVAQGFCAQGAAGRMGGGPEYLLVLADGQAVEIVRSGRLYGAPSCVRLTNVGGELVATDPRKEAETRRAAAAW